MAKPNWDWVGSSAKPTKPAPQKREGVTSRSAAKTGEAASKGGWSPFGDPVKNREEYSQVKEEIDRDKQLTIDKELADFRSYQKWQDRKDEQAIAQRPLAYPKVPLVVPDEDSVHRKKNTTSSNGIFGTVGTADDDIGTMPHPDDNQVTVRELTQEEWASLTPQQQNAVQANTLLYNSRDDQEQQQSILAELGYGEDYSEGVKTYASWDDIRNLLDDMKKGENLSTFDSVTNSVRPSSPAANLTGLANSYGQRIEGSTLLQELSNTVPEISDEQRSKVYSAFDTMYTVPAAYWEQTDQADIDNFNAEMGALLAGVDMRSVERALEDWGLSSGVQSNEVEALKDFYGLRG